MKGYSRYAIYWAPEAGRFAEVTSAWLGWDPVTGRDVPHLELEGLPQPVARITADPRTYGFHGTIKPPFRLAEGTSAKDLDLALQSLCREFSPQQAGDLTLSCLDGFVALTPAGKNAALQALAATIVRKLDHFRAPLTAAEIARRNPDRLSAGQRENLHKWGYPYVMEDFSFHLTLSGKLPAATADQVRRALDPVLAPLLPRPFRIESLCLFGQSPQDGRFRLLRRHRLNG